ncbi:MAG: hypothetical protein R3185_04755 [Candidatus Thermoplasmatota archaeon]|nr:hypothetical protein [Candidatus Thermoplasmatota archaeon]
MPPSSPDRAYLDAFLQGARFALFAAEARLQDPNVEQEHLQAVMAELHALFRDTHEGVLARGPLVRFKAEGLGKN